MVNSDNIKNFSRFYIEKDGSIYSQKGQIVFALTDTLNQTGRVIFSKNLMLLGALTFAKYWYHEAIHSCQVMNGFYKYVLNYYGGDRNPTLGVMEYFGNAGSDLMSGISLKNSDATIYYGSSQNDAMKLFFNFINK